jgi:tetratricopeptide (TPR) repeat protein
LSSKEPTEGVVRPRLKPGARFHGPVLGRASVRLALAAGAVLALAFALISPLIGIPGPESALVLGLVLPPFVGAAGARIAIAARSTGLLRSGELLERAVWVASGAIGVPTAILALNGLRAPWCAPLEGLAFMVLGPGIGVLLASVIGVALGTLVAKPRAATALAVMVPIVSALASASLLFTTPAIYAYGHFFGYFPGTLYDPDIAIEAPYLTFRALTAAQIGGFVALVLAGVDPHTARLSRTRARRGFGALAIAAAFFGAAMIGELRATDLGHRSTSESIRERLGSILAGRHCDVIVPRELPRERAERLRDDCDYRVARASSALGLEQRARVTAFFFRSTDEKRQLMGASSTYIAKPWRNEVYLQLQGWPHPVLAHEIVHVVVGQTGVGPFRISGELGGWLPSPGIIEGVAVAIAWEERDGMTPHQWARAMIDLGMAPSIAETEGLGFLLQPASRAYVSNGSFVRWILDTRGPAVIRRLYRTGDFEEALEVPVHEAEAEWRAWLTREIVLPPEALAMAEARFERPAIFSQVCPHRVAALMGTVADEMAAGDESNAVRTCEEILEIDPHDTSARAWLAVALARAGHDDRAREALARLVGPPSASRPVIRAARQGIADAEWALGRDQEARAMYREILEEPLAEEDARQIEVRLLAIESPLPGGEHVRELLAPPPDEPHDAVTAMQAIGRVRTVRPDGLGSYLEARQMIQRERFDRAYEALREAHARGLPSERIAREARRMDGIVAYAIHERARSRAIWQSIVDDSRVPEADRVEARDWLARIAWSGIGPSTPMAETVTVATDDTSSPEISAPPPTREPGVSLPPGIAEP